MNAKDKISKARVTLVLDHPFFGSLALRLPMIARNDLCPTMGTDGRDIFYNSDFVDSISIDETIGVIVHEIMHVALEHHLRRNDRHPALWNIACDFAENDIILQDGFVLPGGSLSGRGVDMTAEEIYKTLPDPIKIDIDVCAWGEVRDMPGSDGSPATAEEIARASAEMKIAVVQAAQAARQYGNLSAGLERMVGEVLHPCLPWRSILRRFVSDANRDEYTWSPPNRRYVHMGLYMPSPRNETMGRIAIIVDTSGSISDHEVNEFAAEITDIMTAYRSSATVIYCDSEVAGHEEFTADDLPLRLHPRGGGGTDFRPGFRFIDEEMVEPPACAVYMTDGDCDTFPGAPPEYPVLWAVTGAGEEFAPPWGQVLRLSQGS